jgi:hypothetical protein
MKVGNFWRVLRHQALIAPLLANVDNCRDAFLAPLLKLHDSQVGLARQITAEVEPVGHLAQGAVPQLYGVVVIVHGIILSGLCPNLGQSNMPEGCHIEAFGGLGSEWVETTWCPELRELEEEPEVHRVQLLGSIRQSPVNGQG